MGFAIDSSNTPSASQPARLPSPNEIGLAHSLPEYVHTFPAGGNPSPVRGLSSNSVGEREDSDGSEKSQAWAHDAEKVAIGPPVTGAVADGAVLGGVGGLAGPERKDRVDADFSPEDKAVERKMLRKFDWTILPVLTIMYLFNALDKGNLGNAKTDGLDKDIGLHGNQYYLLITIFYVPFCLFGTPISLLIKRFTAARVLPLMMIGFGTMCICTSAVKNFAQIFTIRFFLGIFESAMLPGVVFYLSTFYRRNELAGRIGIFYAAAAISGAFSGLIAYGVFQIQHSKYHGWQFL